MLDRDEQLKVSSTGLKLFERQEAKVPFLTFDSLCLQVFPVSQQDLCIGCKPAEVLFQRLRQVLRPCQRWIAWHRTAERAASTG